MKKLTILLAFASLTLTSVAQQSAPAEKYSVATNTFWSNWFVQANLAGTAFYGDQENYAANPFEGFRNNMGLSVALGKWFTPGFALRTKFNGVWGRSVFTKDVETNEAEYWTLHEQAMFNLSNLFCGYSDTRVWNVIPFAGAGVGRNMSYNSYAMGVSLGLLNQWRLSRHVAVNLEVQWGIYESDFDGFAPHFTDNGLRSKDQTLSAEVGLTIGLGKQTFDRVPDVNAMQELSQRQMDELYAKLANEQAENERLRKQVADQPKTTNAQVMAVSEVEAAPVSVFFNISKSKIASRKDLEDVKELVALAKQNNRKLLVTGYADSCTGTPAINQKLSQQRAETVADEIVAMGFSRDDLEIVAAGGVDTLQPCPYNRRAVVSLK